MAKPARTTSTGTTPTPTRRRAELASPPTWIKPQLAELVEKAPDGPEWAHEIKFDGYRMHARLDAGRVQILTRRGNDWTDKYPAIVKAIGELPARNAYLDGELCGVMPDGRTAFNLIQNATDTSQGSLVFFLFDLLFLDGENLMALPLVERKTRLAYCYTVRRTRCDTTSVVFHVPLPLPKLPRKKDSQDQIAGWTANMLWSYRNDCSPE